MAYRFTGFFAQPSIDRPTMLSGGAVWREIATPFIGVAVRMPDLTDDELAPTEARRLLAEFGLGGATNWLYLSYVTWAGRVAGVYGLGASGGRDFGPLGEWDSDAVRAVFLTLMGEFGVAQADAINFPPFARGFWGE